MLIWGAFLHKVHIMFISVFKQFCEWFIRYRVFVLNNVECYMFISLAFLFIKLLFYGCCHPLSFTNIYLTLNVSKKRKCFWLLLFGFYFWQALLCLSNPLTVVLLQQTNPIELHCISQLGTWNQEIKIS